MKGVDQTPHLGFAAIAVGVAVGVDHGLVDTPGRLDLHVAVVGEQGGDPGWLFVGEQVRAGAQGATGGAERIAGAVAVTEGFELGPSPAVFFEALAGQPDYVERVHHRGRVGELLGGCGFEPG